MDGAKSTSCNASEFLSAKELAATHTHPHESLTPLTHASIFLGGDSGRSGIGFPAVNTCTLNNQKFLTIIECRASHGCARSLSLYAPSHYVALLVNAASRITRMCTYRRYRCCLLISRRCTEAGIVYTKRLFSLRECALSFFMKKK